MNINTAKLVLVVTIVQVAYVVSLDLLRMKRTAATEYVCQLPPITGMCRALFRMYYYNDSSNTCQPFAYGGCGGNGNKFWTPEDCIEACGGTIVENENLPSFFGDYEYEDEDPCDSDLEYGNCDDIIFRFYYDGEKCSPFPWSGCGGNSNNFKSKQDCLKKCVPGATDLLRIKSTAATEYVCQLPPITGMCRALFRMFYYNASSNTCQPFAYGGCRGNGNKFWTPEDCIEACGGIIVENEKIPSFFGDYEYEDPCDSDLEYGNCDDIIFRFYYDGEKCSPFPWSGCGGNSNNFKSKQDCLKKCVPGATGINRNSMGISMKSLMPKSVITH